MRLTTRECIASLKQPLVSYDSNDNIAKLIDVEKYYRGRGGGI